MHWAREVKNDRWKANTPGITYVHNVMVIYGEYGDRLRVGHPLYMSVRLKPNWQSPRATTNPRRPVLTGGRHITTAVSQGCTVAGEGPIYSRTSLQRRGRFRGEDLGTLDYGPELRFSRYFHDSPHSLARVKPARLSGIFHAYLGDYVTSNGQAFTDHGTMHDVFSLAIPHHPTSFAPKKRFAEALLKLLILRNVPFQTILVFAESETSTCTVVTPLICFTRRIPSARVSPFGIIADKALADPMCRYALSTEPIPPIQLRQLQKNVLAILHRYQVIALHARDALEGVE
ncbi:hypothetical protein EDB84DRAFT_1442701 [Lactarius hengduanensis]|nr:hypothetical protein EDB84DRAFT_1442701 [Lactarius hengduanensis]